MIYGQHAKVMEKAAKALNLTWTKYGLYIGYDNFSGREYMRGEAIAKALQAAGIDTYQHTVED